MIAPARRTSAGSAATRAQFLDAAGALMGERQTIDVPLADIADRAGLNVALVSYHFGGREGLLLALARRDADAALRELDSLLATDLSPSEKIRRHFTGMITTFFRFPYLHRLLTALLRESDSEAARDVTGFFLQPIVRAHTTLVEQAVEAGEAQPIDPMVFHFAVVGACANFFSQRPTLQMIFGIDTIDEDLCRRYADTTLNLILNGFLARPSQSAGDKRKDAL